MFENLFEEAESVIKQNLEVEADNYILESDMLDEVEFCEGLEEIHYSDDYEEIIVEGEEMFDELGLLEYEDMDFDEDELSDEEAEGEEVDDSEETDDLEAELYTPSEDSYTTVDDEENDDWLEESWMFDVDLED